MKALVCCISEPHLTMVGNWMLLSLMLCTCPQWIFKFCLPINGPDQGPESEPTNAKITLTWSPHQMRIGPPFLSTETGSVLQFRTLMASPSANVPIQTRQRKSSLILQWRMWLLSFMLHDMEWSMSPVWTGDWVARQTKREFARFLLWELVNSIMNFVFMTLPCKVWPSTDLALQMPESIKRQGFGKHICMLMGRTCFLDQHFLIKCMLVEVMQLNG